MSVSNTQVNGWAPEATPEADPINAADAIYWKFGRYAQKFDMGTETHDWRSVYYQNSRDPNSMVLSKAHADSVISFQPVNGLPFFYFLGAAAGATTHTLSGINTGTLPTRTYRWEDRGGTAERFSSVVGQVTESLVMLANFGNQAAIPLTIATSMAGIKQIQSTYNLAHNGPQFPTNDGTMTGTQIDNVYRKDSNMAFEWDSSGDAIDYVNQVEQIQYTGANILQKQDLVEQAERETIYSGNRVHTLLFRIKRGTDASLFDDFNSRVVKSLRFRIYNTATEYIQVTFNDVAPQSLQQPFSPQNDTPFWQCNALVKSITPIIKDGIADSFYGI